MWKNETRRVKTVTQTENIEHTQARLGEYLKGKWKKKITHLEYIINIDIKLISEEGTLLWLSSKDKKADIGREITVVQHQALNLISSPPPKKKYWKQKQVAIAGYVENLRQNGSHCNSVPNIGKRIIRQAT